MVLAASASEIDSKLLERLAEHDDRMEKYLDAHLVHIDAAVRDLDGDGKLIHTTVTKLDQKRVNGKLSTKVLSSTKDGEDRLADETERAAKSDAENKRTESPFAPRNQGKYRFKGLGPLQPGSELQLIAFEPKGEKSSELLEGVGVVDPAAGEVVQLKMKPSKLPMFADAMEMEIRYDNATEAGRNISFFKLAGAGGVLFIKRQGDLTLKFAFAP